MASSIWISSVTGNSPYDVYVCDVLGSNCVYVTTITSVPVTIILPSLFDGADTVLVKIIDSEKCEIVSIESCYFIFCVELGPDKNNIQNYDGVPIGYLNGKPLYEVSNQIDTFGYIIWNPTTNRWEFVDVPVNGTLYSYLDNTNPYPISLSGDSWIYVSGPNQIYGVNEVCRQIYGPTPTPPPPVEGCFEFILSPSIDYTFVYYDCNNCQQSIFVGAGGTIRRCIQSPYQDPWATNTLNPCKGPPLREIPKQPYQLIYDCCTNSLVGYWNGQTKIIDGVYSGTLETNNQLTQINENFKNNYKSLFLSLTTTINLCYCYDITLVETISTTLPIITTTTQPIIITTTEATTQPNIYSIYGCFNFVTIITEEPKVQSYNNFISFISYYNCEYCIALSNPPAYCALTTTTTVYGCCTTGGTFDNNTCELELYNNNGQIITISGFTCGQTGSAGTSGISGTDGSSGTSGSSGLSYGTSGTSGESGSSGTSGRDGSSGINGTSGVNGTSGTSGFDGSSGIDGLDAANSHRWEFLSTGAYGDAFITQFLTDNDDLTLITKLSISVFDFYLNNTYSWWNLANNLNSLGNEIFLQIREVNGISLATYRIIDINERPLGGTFDIQVQFISGNGFVGNINSISWVYNGLNGTSGNDGSSGTSGSSGLSYGTSGTSGVSGTDGSSGSSGTSGVSGADGSSGTSGTSGISGTDGSSGTSGTSGVSGTSGISGTDGSSGTSGTSGISGTDGSSGTSGTSGSSGISGTSGTSGTSGSSGVNGAGGALGYYGSFYSNQDQSATTINTEYAMTLNVTAEANGVYINSNSQITFSNPGTYDIQFSCQLYREGGAGSGDEIDIWLRKNGLDVPDTNTKIVVTNNNRYSVAAWDFLVTFTGYNEHIELMWSTNNLNIYLQHEASATPHPAIPSLIVTAIQVMYTQSGTSGTSGVSGSSGTSGISGSSGTSGLSGSNGSSGTSGNSGTSGISGSSGTSGLSGSNGSSGTSGVNGDAGAKGESGTSGTSGTSAPSIPGTPGSSGTSGLDGSSGTSGSSGSSGVSGTNGSSGTSGLTGSSGTSGSSGSSGTSGLDGTSGTSGLDGSSGTSGSSGSSGVSGTNGSSGTSGLTGTAGTSGSSGTSPGAGALTFSEGPSIPSAANINDYALTDNTFFKISGTTASNITGFSGGSAGRFIIIVNNTDKNQTFQQENTNSSASNRLVLGVSNKTIGINQSVTFIYVTGLTVGGVGSQSRWVLTSTT